MTPDEFEEIRRHLGFRRHGDLGPEKKCRGRNERDFNGWISNLGDNGTTENENRTIDRWKSQGPPKTIIKMLTIILAIGWELGIPGPALSEWIDGLLERYQNSTAK